MILFPNAKINIGLNIIEKRPDHFHNIQSVFYPVALCDALEVIENTADTKERVVFTFSGIEIPGSFSDNLCYRAYYLIAGDYVLPNVKVHLHKHIPIGAGLGGGSADAAFFIRLLNDLFRLGISWGEMHHYARQLGSDCSFFISNRPVFAENKGDEYESILLDLSAYHIVLIYPGIHINTAKAYDGIVPAVPRRSLEQDVLSLPMEEWRHHVHNDFETRIFSQHPPVKAIKDKLYAADALYAAMSGSGSAVYGIFKEATHLRSSFPGCFVWESKL